MSEATTQTEVALPPLVAAVQADFSHAAETIEAVAAHLERLEGQLRLDRESATTCRGTASALRTHASHLREEASDFARRVSPDRLETSETPTVKLVGAA